MPVKIIYQEIAFEGIDLTDRTFVLAPPPDNATTKAELHPAPAFLVLLLPPLLLPGPTGKMLVVSGLELLSAQDLPSVIGCLVLPIKTPPAEALELALTAILARRPATALEQAHCWAKAENWLGESEALTRFAPLLELLKRYPPGQLRRLLELPAAHAAALHGGRLELRTAFRLLELPPLDGNRLFEVIETLRLSSANQKKLLDIAWELGKRKEQTLADLLDSGEGPDILATTGANPTQRTTRLMQWLTGLLFPRLTLAEKDFQSYTAGLELPGGVTLEHSPAFEKETLRLTIELPDRKALTACWPALRKALRDGRRPPV